MKKNLPIRKNIRLKQYDYSQKGYYFITICIKNRRKILSRIENNNFSKKKNNILTKEGNIVDKHLKNIELIYNNVELGEYVIMPDHIHMILIKKQKDTNTISKIIQQLKGKITKEIGYSIWHKLFYDSIIKTKKDYLIVKKYIKNNPNNWKNDTYY